MAAPYQAFISYSHKADGQLAPALQRELQRFGIPWYGPPALRLFRDETSLSATPGLWPAIETALQDSEHFLLLASPDAAKSEWVQREVAWWLEHKSPQTMLIALTDGQIKRDPGAGDFNWQKTDALPPNLKDVFHENPLWVDLRWADDPSQLTPRNPQFEVAMADIAAPLRGLSKERLIGDEVLRHRRVRQMARTAGAILAVLTIGMLFLFIRSRWEEERANLSNSQLLAQQSNAALDKKDFELAALLSHSAFSATDTPAAQQALLSTLAQGPIASLGRGEPPAHVVKFSQSCEPAIGAVGPSPYPSAAVRDVAFSQDGRSIVSIDSNGIIRVWRLPATSAPAALVLANGDLRSVDFSADGGTIVTGGSGGAALWGVGSLETGCLLSDADITTLAFTPDGTSVVIGDATGGVSRVDIDSHEIEPLTGVSSNRRVRAIEPSAGGWIAAARDDGTVYLWNSAGAPPRTLDLSAYGFADPSRATVTDAAVSDIALSPSGELLVAVYADGSLVPWDTQTSTQILDPLNENSPHINDLQFSPDGTILATADDRGQITLWRTEDWQPTKVFTHPGTSKATSIAFGPDGSLLVSGHQDGTTILWSTVGPALSCRFDPTIACRSPQVSEMSNAVSVAFDPSSDRMAVGGDGKSQICTLDDSELACDEPFVKDGPVIALAYSHDGHWLAAAEGIGRIVVHGPSSDAQPVELPNGFVPEHLALSADGAMLAASGTLHNAEGNERQSNLAKVLFWDLRSTKIPSTLLAGVSVTALAFRPDDSLLVAAGGNSVTAWPLNNGSPGDHGYFDIRPGQIRSVAFDSQGARLASGDANGQILIWDARDQSLIWNPGEKSSQAVSMVGEADTVAFSPDGRYLAAGSNNGEIVLWDTMYRVRSGPVAKLDDAVLAVNWSDSHSLVAVDAKGVVFSFEINPQSWSDRACLLAGRDLVISEAQQYFGDGSRRVCQRVFGDNLSPVSSIR